MLNHSAIARMVKRHNRSFSRNQIPLSDIAQHPDFHQGKGAEQLGLQMERLYADWFCDSDLTTAQADMMHKRGDGLEVDWSQPRFGCRLDQE